MDFSAQTDHLLTAFTAWIPVILQYCGKVLLALITLWIGWWIINRLTGRLAALFTLRHMDQALETFVVTLVNIGLKVMLVISVASMIGIATTSFVAALGAASLAIGLSLQGSLANFAGGVLILLFRPFKIGDYIEAQGVQGTVDSIQIFHTVLRTGDNKTVTIPNGNLSNGIITNQSRQTTRQIVFDVKVGYDADLQKAKQVLTDMAKDPRVLDNPAPAIVVAGLGDTFITVSLRCWTANSDFWGTQFSFNEQIRDRLRAEGIDIALPSRVVKVVGDKGDDRATAAARGEA
ncbi:mechanosensitive ion channel family protein [Pseudomonas oryzihabitans]|uniref:mechanosensitive ion channel family protein n=1 Tax=Pseudomonas oryzihabitans TaxID=47885 RepID=UPI0011A3FF67|nr:mechanosensitive ion channel family protein [Pseudomonas psychrotolerans]